MPDEDVKLDVTPQATKRAGVVERDPDRARVDEATRDEISPSWEPEPGETFSPADTSLRAIIARAKANRAQGYPEFDPVYKPEPDAIGCRVFWRTTGRWVDGKQIYSPQLRAVGDRQTAIESGGRLDFWSHEYGCWVRDGTTTESDPDLRRTDNLVSTLGAS